MRRYQYELLNYHQYFRSFIDYTRDYSYTSLYRHALCQPIYIRFVCIQRAKYQNAYEMEKYRPQNKLHIYKD
jgi:hypothetical protein